MISMYRKKLILNYHIKDGYGAKRIIKVMKQRGEKPASRGVIRRLINTYDRIIALPDRGQSIALGKCQLKAVPAHFLHSVGNFQIYDPVSKILFSGDMGLLEQYAGRLSALESADLSPVDHEAEWARIYDDLSTTNRARSHS